MANLSILSGVEFYSYDVEVYDKVLLGTIRYKEHQIAKFKKIDKTFFENKSFYGINRVELIREFIKYLSKYDDKIDKDSFLLNDVVDKRIKKGTTYINDTMIFTASPKQYDAQAMAKAKEEATQKIKVQQEPKEILKLPMEYKDKIYKVRLNLEELGIGTGQKMLYDFNEKMLKSKVESFLKSYKKEYDVQLSLQEEFIQVGKLLIDVTVYDDRVEGFIDLSSLNLGDITSIRAEGKDKQELLNNIIQQLKAHKLTGKLNWGTVTDKTSKKGDAKVAKTVDMKDLKALVKNISTMVKKVGMDEKEIDGRIYSILPNISDLGVGNLGGENINLAYVLPWKFDKEKVKMKKFAEEVAETHPSNIVIKEVDLSLYIIDENDSDIRISIDADVKWVNTFFGSLEQDSYVLVENYVKVKVEQGVTGNLLLQEFIEKIASRSNVKLAVKIDKDTPFPVSFDVNENGFEQASVRFENNATKYRATFRLDGPFSELQPKTYSFYHYLDGIGFNVSQEGLGVVVRGVYKEGDISIINDLATLLDKIKGFSYNHAESFEAWAKKHKYGYVEAKVFYQVRDIIPNYEGDAIVYKSGKSQFIAIPEDVEGVEGFIDEVKHIYTPEKHAGFYRFYFTNLELMKEFIDFANKIDKPAKQVQVEAPAPEKQDLGQVLPKTPAIKEFVVEKGDKIFDKVPFIKGQIYEVDTVIKALIAGEADTIETLQFEVLSIFKNGKVRCRNTKLGYEFKLSNDPASGRKVYRLIKDVDVKKKEINKEPKAVQVEAPKAVQVEAPKDVNIEEPANREVERTFKASKVKDPAHKEQLERMRNYVKKIADVVDADNDFALRFLEEPKEFQKYKLPTVGVGLFYYGDKSISELEQNALYKKVYKGRGLSILRKFFKTTDLNGEKCLLVLFVDAQYAKETKAKLIKECFNQGNKISINGRFYSIKAIYEKQFSIMSGAGLLYIDNDSDLIDLIVED